MNASTPEMRIKAMSNEELEQYIVRCEFLLNDNADQIKAVKFIGKATRNRDMAHERTITATQQLIGLLKAEKLLRGL